MLSGGAVTARHLDVPRVHVRPPDARDAHLATRVLGLDLRSNAAATVTSQSESQIGGACAP